LVNKRLGGVFSTSELMFFHGLIAVPLLALFVPHGAWGAVNPKALAVLAGGALGPGAIAGLLFVWGLRKLPASHVSTLTLLEPFVAVVLGATLLGESIGAPAVLGGALILTGAALVIHAARTAKQA
jgi:drug/metabolite transporter (DMT)-like permease